MKIIRKAKAMQKLSDSLKKDGRAIGLVPTMGALHDGHVSLIKKCTRQSDVTVLSIFLNPLQFAENEDLAGYPKQFNKDKKIARSAGVDYIFAPGKDELYSDSFSSVVKVSGVTENLCGAVRPGHFEGVATVVAKLFNIVKPERAYFGEKDYQQLVVIKKMASDLNFDIKIIGCKTIRESDGLAMSSRNAYLTSEERERATVLYKSLMSSKQLFLKGENSSLKIIKNAVSMISFKRLEIDYVKIVDLETLKDVKKINGSALMAIAARIGTARLIDNSVLKK